ncbi:glycosyl hydrolase family 79 C-terminal domain-containing protein [Silvibacterium dinghuense]|uniref:Beta-glucuronidase C-terminal domain-containing protein n=1 Tax=Silvibacterium dinghuense TaxID=1560006 RepID=A0A4Q1SBN2_9BACT|nr:glycosyl hydrolase family 79 C-terminal domain-containing protein [Silvibacterium dinghuense]RXS94417.1 hypothetical protein ESZ00_15190 [Silvibacterium dinghuense]GGH16247.1 hypothetical protein GCM10011586_37930 [Silvibacterium dinghuense]
MSKILRSVLAIGLVFSSRIPASWASDNNPPTEPSHVTATVKIDPNARKQSIAPSFLGLSMVLSETKYAVGTSTASNPYFKRLLQNFLVYGNGPLELRELNDKAFTASTTSDDLPALSNLYKEMQALGQGVRYFVGVDFSGNFDAHGNESGMAATEAETIFRSLPQGSLLSYEIGNEPDLYNQSGLRTGYTYPQFKREYEKTAAAIEAKKTGVPMAAPVFSGYPGGFMKNLDDFISSESAHLGMLDLHNYGGSHCNGRVNPEDYLLSDDAVNMPGSPIRPTPANVSGYIRALNRAGRSNFRIGEMNSIACGGQDGVSNTFQSALWFLDEAMSFASAGVSGINLFTIESSNAYYTPFRFSHTGSFPSPQYAIAQINPIYYGVLTTAEMLQSRAALIPVTLSTSRRIKAYATVDEQGVVRVLLINKEEGRSGDGSVALHLAEHRDAVISALRATNDDYRVSDYTHYTADDRITLAGQTFKVAGGAQDGILHGAPEHTTVHPRDGVYLVSLPHSSAAIVEIR